MSRLYLTCGLCGRKQADGMLSRGYWGHFETGSHGTLRACPTCKEQYTDWQSRLLAALNGTGAHVSGPAWAVRATPYDTR